MEISRRQWKLKENDGKQWNTIEYHRILQKVLQKVLEIIRNIWKKNIINYDYMKKVRINI